MLFNNNICISCNNYFSPIYNNNKIEECKYSFKQQGKKKEEEKNEEENIFNIFKEEKEEENYFEEDEEEKKRKGKGKEKETEEEEENVFEDEKEEESIFEEEKEEEIKKNYNELDKSKIIKNEEEKQKIIEWVSSKGNINEIILIYNATEDGDSNEAFFNKIENKGPIISFVKTKAQKRWGGFTKVDWKKNAYFTKDENAFLFSLDDLKKYNILNSTIAFGCYPNYTLVYGNALDAKGIYLSNNNFFILKVGPSNREDLSTKVYDVPSDHCLTNETIFEVEEVEVYQIIFK